MCPASTFRGQMASADDRLDIIRTTESRHGRRCIEIRSSQRSALPTRSRWRASVLVDCVINLSFITGRPSAVRRRRPPTGVKARRRWSEISPVGVVAHRRDITPTTSISCEHHSTLPQCPPSVGCVYMYVASYNNSQLLVNHQRMWSYKILFRS